VLLELIGEGGMGQIFKARQRHLGRIVALKVIRKECIDDPKIIARFQREIRASGQLSHPNIVHAYDADQSGSTYYIAMEYIDGVDLARLVRQNGPLPVDEACDYVRQAALGLQHAHERGLVHRDIKPANLLVARNQDKARASSGKLLRPGVNSGVNPGVNHAGKAPSGLNPRPSRFGTLKVLDLGLARWDDTVTGRPSTHLTMMGTVMGTPDFIAPEQARNAHTCDIRSDLYSLGCTFYFLLSGRIPFPNGALTEKLLQHQLDDPEPIATARRTMMAAHLQRKGQTKVSRRLLAVPDSVAAVVKKLMAKRPEERFQTPGELAAALDKVVEGLAKAVEPKAEEPTIELGPAQPTPAQVMPAEPTMFEPAPPVKRDVGEADTPMPGAVPAGAATPRNRRRWLYAAAAAAGFLTLLGALRSDRTDRNSPSAPRAAATSVQDVDADWQALEQAAREKRLPDDALRAKLLAFQSSHPHKARAVAKLVRDLASPFDAFERSKLESKQLFAWMPDELVGILGLPRGWQAWRPRHAAAVTADGRHIVSAEDRVLRMWEAGGSPLPHRIDAAAGRIVDVAASPDGTRLAAAGDDGAVAIYAIPSCHLARQLDHGSAVTKLAFHPGGGLLASAGGGIVRLWDAASGKLLQQIETNTSRITALAFAPDGRHLAWGGVNHEVRWATLDGRNPETWKFTACTGPVAALAFHPDGRTSVCSGGDPLLRWCAWDGDKMIETKRLDKHTSPVTGVAFSPDGRWLVSVGEDNQIVVWDAATGSCSKSWELRWPIHAVAWAPDSRHFIVANANGTLFVFRA